MAQLANTLEREVESLALSYLVIGVTCIWILIDTQSKVNSIHRILWSPMMSDGLSIDLPKASLLPGLLMHECKLEEVVRVFNQRNVQGLRSLNCFLPRTDHRRSTSLTRWPLSLCLAHSKLYGSYGQFCSHFLVSDTL